MNKAALLEQLTNEYERIGTPVLVNTTAGIKTYDLTVFEVKDTGSLKKTVPFYVLDEGEETEEAFLRQFEGNDFATDVREYAATLVTGDIKKVVPIKIFDNFAECNTYTLVVDQLVRSESVIIKEDDGLHYYALTE